MTVKTDGTPYALASSPELGRLYVVLAPYPDLENPRQVAVYQIPAGGPAWLATVKVGAGGSQGGGGIAINPTTRHVFITNSSDATVSIFDGSTLASLGLVAVGADPRPVAVDPVLNSVYIGNHGSDNIIRLVDTP